MMDPEGDYSVMLERIFLAVVMAESDESFEKIINKVLPSILNKISSPNEGIRSKIIELLTHISKRIKAAKQIQLPVEELLSQYSDPSASTFTINFFIIYIKIGFPRLSMQKKFELLPKLISSAVNKPIEHQESILLLLITSIRGFAYPRDENVAKNLFNLEDKGPLRKLLLQLIMDIFMFPYGCTDESRLSDISVYSYQRLIRDGFIDTTPDSMEKLKIDCLQLVTCGLYTSSEEYPALVMASADARSSVSQLAEDRLKKISQDIDRSKPTAVSLLYHIYLGRGGSAGDDESKLRKNISLRVRLKILQHISKFSVVLWPMALKIHFESLYGTYTNHKLRMFALTFAATFIQHLEEHQLQKFGEVILELGLMKLLKQPDIEVSLSEKIYPLISQLVRRCPSIVSKDLSLLSFMFEAIEENGESEIGRVIRDSAASMSPAFKSSSHGPLPGLVELKLSSSNQKARSLALTYISNSLEPSALRTYLLLFASCLSDDEVRNEAKKSLYMTGEGKSVKHGNFAALLSLVIERESEKPHPSVLLKEIVLYLRLCLAGDCGIEQIVGPSDQVSHPSENSPLISKFLRQVDIQLMDSYIALLFRLLKEDSGVIPLSALLEVIGCIYPGMADKHLDQIPVFQKLATEGSSDSVRDLASEIWGLLASRVDPPPLAQLESHILALSNAISKIDSPPLQYLNTISQSIREPTNILQSLKGLSLISQAGKLQLLDSQLDSIVDNLIEVFLKNESNKAKERAITAIGYICIGEKTTKLRGKVIDKLLESAKEVKDIELILSCGQTLVSAIMGSESPFAGDPWTREKSGIESEGVGVLAGSTLERILKLITTDRRPAVRQSLCFWLLAVTKHCSEIEMVKVSLGDIQGGFIDLLNDNNGLIQEGAGKGLALVYEAGDEKARQDLLKTVVEQLGSGKRLGQVSSETKLFEEGELGQTPTGEKLSTYKELCNLASDLNQPDLIYKFMSLAHHNAIWNSKKGAAFTVASLAQKAGPEFQEHLPSVLIRLYRYQYDPIGHVRQAMSEIWSSLATQDTVVKYRAQIFDDLLSNLVGREWRVRYSSCRGIADLMRGPAGTFLLEERKDHMVELWSQLFRVMDDIHKDTRLEATKTAATLAKVCAIPVILPVLLDKGIMNPATEVRLLSLATINEMLKKGLDEKDVVKVISAYLKYELDPKSFVQYVKVGMMEELSAALIDSLKHSVRGGRVSAANFITLLSHQLTLEEIQPYIGKFLGALLSGAKDKNRRIRTEFGSTMGHLLRYAKDSSVQRLFERLTSLYIDSHSEDEVKWGVTEAVDSAVQHSQDAVEEIALPLVFLAKHEILNEDKTNLKRIERWEEAFKQICPGVGRLTTFQSEIITLLLMAIKSQFWALKAQGGKATRTLAEKVSDLQGKEKLFDALVETLEGRVWPGKEALLSPLPFVGKNDEAANVLMREASRGNNDYKVGALTYLGETKPHFSTVSPVISQAVEQNENKVLEAAIRLIGKCTVEENELDRAMKLCFDSMEKVAGASLESLVELSRDRSDGILTTHVSQLVTAISLALESKKKAVLRRYGLNILQNLQTSFSDNSEAYNQIKTVFDKFSSDLESDSDPGVRSRAIAIKEKFKERYAA